MEYSSKSTFGKRLASFLLVFVLVSSTILPALSQPAQAQGIPIMNIYQDVLRPVLKTVAQLIAKKMLDEMVRSSIQWANTGFEGGPAFVTNPAQFFSGIADGVAGDYIMNDANFGFLCSPFQAQIRLSIRNAYAGPAYSPQCTLSEIADNIEGFYENFSEGGWDTWFAMTQNDMNNPYGAYIEITGDLDARIAERLNIEDKKLGWSSGFKSKGDCVRYDNASAGGDEANAGDLDYDPGQSVGTGECIEYGPDKTPGKVIADQVNKSLGVGVDKLVSAKEIDELISAFATGLLSRFVFGPQGLFSSNSNDYNPQEPPPVDGRPPLPTWIPCANEGERCEFRGTAQVRFGSSGIYNTMTLTSGTECTIAIFGDPAPGKTKGCEYSYATQGSGTHPPLKVSCRPTIASAPLDESIPVYDGRDGVGDASNMLAATATWVATISGGSGRIAKIAWGDLQWDDTRTGFWEKPFAGGGNWWREFPMASSTDPVTGITTLTQKRHYIGGGNAVEHSRNANLTVIDSDPLVSPVIEAFCIGQIFIFKP